MPMRTADEVKRKI